MDNWIKIFKRSEWGAQYGEGWDIRPLPATEAWLHHTETNQLSSSATFEQDAAEVRYVDRIGYLRFNYADEGWKRPAGAGISYTWVVAPSGRVFEGHDPARTASHTSGHNTAGVGIALIGNYQNNVPNSKQIDAVARLLLQAKDDGIITKARLDGGHMDVFNTDCPGAEGMKAIAKINARVAELTNSPTPTPDPTPAPAYYWGNDAAYVNWVQSSLKTLGYYAGVVDGSAGPATKDAVKKFQTANGLTADGEAGPITKAAIEKAIVVFYTPKWWSDTAFVTDLQSDLLSLSFYHGPITGQGDETLVAAIREFQSEFGLAPTGDPDGVTVTRIDEEVSEYQERLLDEYIAINRVAGSNRWATARRIASAAFPAGRGVIIAADGTPDLILAGTRATSEVRVLPVKAGAATAPGEIVQAVKEYNPQWVRIVGGEASVTNGAAKDIFRAAGLI